jgi:hypothetical protein
VTTGSHPFRPKAVDMKYVAVAALLLSVAMLPLWGGVLFALFLFGLFLLALVGVLSGLDDRAVRQRDPVLDPRGWRNGS